MRRPGSTYCRSQPPAGTAADALWRFLGFPFGVAKMLSSRALVAVSKKAPPVQVQAAYALFSACTAAVYYFIANGEFSAILTMAVMLQCLGFALLAVQTFSTGTADGISAKALLLDALALCCRLSSTTWLHGYLPVDASGDWVYQAVDLASLALVLWLLHRLLVSQRQSYQAEDDTFPLLPMVVFAFILAALLHADMNARPVFDTLWMAGLFVSVVAVLPQLWLIARNGGKVEALTSHYIAAIAASRALSGAFMWHARGDITCEQWVDGVNHSIWAILSAHAVHMLLLGDFAYYYLRAMAKGGISGCLELGDDLGV